MNVVRTIWPALLSMFAAATLAGAPATAQQPQKPNILFIMGDDIGWMQPSIYHRGLMVGETPNIDRIGHEGAIFMDYVAMQSCTSGRNAFFTGMYPLRTGMIPPQLPGSPTLPEAGNAGAREVPARPRLHHRRVRQEPPRRSHRGAADGARLPGVLGLSLSPRRHAAGELPRHQQVARRCRASRRRARTRRSPACPRCPAPSIPKTTLCLTPPRPVLVCKSSDGTEENQTCKDEGPLTLDRSQDRRRGNLGEGHRLPRPQRSRRRPTSRSSSGTTRRACTSRPCCPTSTRRWSASPAARTGASTKPA